MNEQTVLIVNDDSGARDRLAELLSDEGFMSVSAGSSAEALKLAEERGPGVALLDVALTDDMGTRLVSDLHDLDPDWVCAVITSEVNIDGIACSYDLGAEQYLPRNLDNIMLLNQLRLLLDMARLRSENRVVKLALRESEARFSAIFERSQDLIHIKDRSLRYSYINPAAERFFGLGASEMLGKTDTEIFGEYQESPGASVDRRVLNGKMHEEDRVSTVGGAEIYHYITRLPVRDSQGEACGVLTIGRDVTEKKMLETKLVRAQKMEAIGVLAGGIAHDFNNILGAMVGHVELAGLMEKRGQLAGHHLEEVLKATKRASDLVKQILAFTRHSDQELNSIELAPIVRECMQLLRAALPTTITIEQYIDDGPCVVMANPTHIHQIIMNLATNAGHAMADQRGTLTVRLSHGDGGDRDFKSPARKSDNIVEISVEDNGCGIDDETIQKIFDPYFTTKAEGVGTGLGLAVVHDLVKRTKGTLLVESEPGAGSVFKVQFPRVSAKNEKKVEKEKPLPVGKECILYVDDEETLVEIGQNLFERLGYTVIGKTDPLDALTYYLNNIENIDLVLTDQTMPKMTGVELAREIRKVRCDLPVMICSGFAASPEYEAARDIPGITFLRKPIVIREFAETVRSVLDSRKSE